MTAAAVRLTAGPPLLAAALAVALTAALTRGLHLDGLADLADGLGSHAAPQRAREIMKQPDVGALGTAAVVLVLGVQVAALLACVQAGRATTAVVLALVTARLAVTAACTGTPAATGTGLGALVAGTVPRGWTGGLALATVAAATGLGALQQVPLWQPALAVAAALGASRLLRAHAVRRLGGLTGDVLGALVETATTVVLVVLAISP